MLNSTKRRRWLLLAIAMVAAWFFASRDRSGSRDVPPAGPTKPSDTANTTAPVAEAKPANVPVDIARSSRRPGALFSFAQPPESVALDRALPAPAQKIHYVRLNTALLAGKQSPFWQRRGAGRVELPLPDGGALTLVIDESEMLGADRFTSVGWIEGRPASTAVFAFNQGFLHASISDPVLGSFALRAATEEFSQFYRIDPNLVGPCGGERRPVVDDIVRGKAMAPRAPGIAMGGTAEPVTPPLAAAENPQRAEVHVMMVYTRAVLPTLTGTARVAALQSAFDAAIAKVNSAFDASAITPRVRLVRILETQYAGDGAATGSFYPNLQNDALDALYKVSDGAMDEIHAARDQAGADIVCLAMNRPDAESSGLSFLLDQPGDPMNAQFSFSVVQYTSIAGTNVVTHEFGHVFGCAHDRANARSGPGAYGYSYGYNFVASDNRRYHDIMSYPPGLELNYFSNPRIPAPAPAPIGTVGGIAAGQPGESDTARTIEQMAFEVSTFRLQTQATSNLGRLINVATLAYSGPGNQVLIGGFFVEGSAPKRILVRGSGPGLAGLGVAGALTDPVLRVFSGSTQIAFNDNWGQQAQPAQTTEVRDSAQEVGAFPFAASSTDAALVLTLPRGGYSAWVEGANGTTGIGMIEAYDVDRGADKVVNLSTRGYADNQGRPMIGGFVVLGAPGSTKRILVRVLGPTLERTFGLSGAMTDPHMEIHNALGELIVQNDDWSTDSVSTGGGEHDDFQPLVRTYGEQQIAATGLLPSNRREPCVLVDLPPGNYTIVAKPFERRSSNPDLDQPAAPGLAILEVYEINP